MRWELSLHASDRLVERFPDLADDVSASMDNAQPFGWQRGNQDTLYLDDRSGIVYVVNMDTGYVRTVLTREQAIGNMQLFPPNRSLVKEVLRATQNYMPEDHRSKGSRTRLNESAPIDAETLAKAFLEHHPNGSSLVRLTRKQTIEARRFAREQGGKTFQNSGPLNEFVGAIYREIKRRREERAQSNGSPIRSEDVRREWKGSEREDGLDNAHSPWSEAEPTTSHHSREELE